MTDENRHGGATGKPGSLIADGLLPCTAESMCVLAWLPLVYAVGTVDWTVGFSAVVPPCAFFFGAALATMLAQNASEGTDVPDRTLACIMLAPCAAGCLAEFLLGPGIPGRSLSLALFGGSSSLGTALWFHRATERRAPVFAVALLLGLLVFSLVAVGALYGGGLAACALALAGTLVAGAFFIRSPRTPKAQREGAAVSRMLEISVARLCTRYTAAFFCLGLLTGGMLTMFTMGMPDPDINAIVLGLPIGAVVLMVLVAVGWALNREPSFAQSFEFAFFVALPSFFPFYPGTLFNQQLSLVLGSVWSVVLAGSALMVSREVCLTCAAARKRPFGPAVSTLLMGLACGTAAMALVLDSSWFIEMERGSYPRIMFATTMGACAIVLSYICTNILIKRSLLRDARLISQGKFAALVQPLPSGSDWSWGAGGGSGGANGSGDGAEGGFGHDAAGATGSAVPGGMAGTFMGASAGGDIALEPRCRDIALHYGLTPREYDMLVVLARGNSMARAQEELVISEGTAITHRRNLYRKLGVTSKQELIDFVRDNG